MLSIAFATALPACGLERLEPTGTDRRLPQEVAVSFQESCNRGLGEGCHSDRASGIDFDSAGAFISTPGLVEAGDVANSLVAQAIADGTMPIGGFRPGRESDRFVITGWIASGAPLDQDDAASTTGAEESSTAETLVEESTMGSDTETGDDSGGPSYVEFIPVLTILQASCGGPTCHRDGGITPPVLEDAVAYENIVGVPSSFSSDMAPYVDPNNSAQSHVVRRITADGYTLMPAAGSLRAEDIDVITAWIDSGAPV